MRFRQVIEHGGREILDVQAIVRFVDDHQLVRLGVRQRSQEHRVYDAENRGSGSDSECKRKHGGDSKDRRPGQSADSETKIAKHIFCYTPRKWS